MYMYISLIDRSLYITSDRRMSRSADCLFVPDGPACMPPVNRPSLGPHANMLQLGPHVNMVPPGPHVNMSPPGLLTHVSQISQYFNASILLTFMSKYTCFMCLVTFNCRYRMFLDYSIQRNHTVLWLVLSLSLATYYYNCYQECILCMHMYLNITCQHNSM